MQLAIKLLTFVDILVALIIIALVLMQRSKAGGGLGGLTGGATEEVFGSSAGNVLTKATIWFTVCFFAITLGLAMLQGRVGKGHSVMDDEEMAPPPAAAESGAPADSGAATPAAAESDAPAAESPAQPEATETPAEPETAPAAATGGDSGTEGETPAAGQ